MIPFALLTSALLSGTALAGSVYINGVRADLLPELTVTNATVRFDGQGNVWIDAPGYRVQVVQPAEYSSAASPVPSPAPSSSSERVGAGAWWLVTEDNASAGHTIEVVVNGTLVRRIASGEPQLILDIGPFLRSGSNTVVVSALAGPMPSGGPLSVYVGRGNNLSGTIRLDNPDVAYTRRASDGGNGGGGRHYTLTVP
ncbi:MAG: hypothetical protein Q8P18_04790 [Pseudomonadota bacterium]|nr:hypothetical protein [Pseudomonadota bacterium]